jgi:hypothetical protein
MVPENVLKKKKKELEMMMVMEATKGKEQIVEIETQKVI